MSYLPGQLLRPDKDTVCDKHSNKESVIKIVGETDSFGSEFHNLCKECLEKYKKDNSKPTTGPCAWCLVTDAELYPTRCSDEGMNGAVSYVCKICLMKQREDVMKELEYYEKDKEIGRHASYVCKWK